MAVKTQTIQNLFLSWVPYVLIITMIAFLLYGVGQQIYRQGANHPQIELSENVVNEIESGNSLFGYNQKVKLEMRETKLPFYILYNKDKRVLSSTVELDGEVPEIPEGVLSASKEFGQHRVTWQPAPDVRTAVVTRYAKGKNGETYVLVGRSLKDAELNIDRLGKKVLLGWIVTVIGSFFVVLASRKPSQS